MKSAAFLAITLLLTAGLAAAQAPAGEITQPDEANLMSNLAQDGAAVAAGGGCELPDFTGMSDEEALQAALEAGFDTSRTAAAAPACPVSFSCSSLGSTCAASTTSCTRVTIGQCCMTSAGLNLCCINGLVKASYCPCQCTGSPCNVQCPSSTNVVWGCF